MSMLVGTDIPQLLVLLQEELPESVTRDSTRDDALLVVTRAQAERERRAGETALQWEEQSGVVPRSLEKLESQELEEEQLSEFPVFGEDFFVTGQTKSRSPRGLREGVTGLRTTQQAIMKRHAQRQHAIVMPLMCRSADEMKVLQDTDTTLQTLKRAAEDDPSEGGYFLRDGLLFRRWTPPGRDVETMAVDQLVLPLQCRDTLLNLAHSTPCAGHLGKDKTTNRILQGFYWPTVHRDVSDFCRQCAVRQKTTHYHLSRVPTIPLPVMVEPFQRVAMDLIGPLPKSRSGKQYVLVMCDYATIV